MRSEIKKINFYGWLLISVTIVLCFLNGVFAILNIISAEGESKLLSNNNEMLIEQRERDSSYILQLETELDTLKRDNDTIKRKQDLIKYAIIDNAAKEMEAANKIFDKKNENTYLRLQQEMYDNLHFINDYLEEDSFLDSLKISLVPTARLQNKILLEYLDISTNPSLIYHFKALADDIDKLNHYLDKLAEPLTFGESKFYRNNIIRLKTPLGKNFQELLKKGLQFQSFKDFETLNVYIP